ncbi:hypothetical protein Q5752_006027 [Cryptotrichosporon argae]
MIPPSVAPTTPAAPATIDPRLIMSRTWPGALLSPLSLSPAPLRSVSVFSTDLNLDHDLDVGSDDSSDRDLVALAAFYSRRDSTPDFAIDEGSDDSDEETATIEVLRTPSAPRHPITPEDTPPVKAEESAVPPDLTLVGHLVAVASQPIPTAGAPITPNSRPARAAAARAAATITLSSPSPAPSNDCEAFENDEDHAPSDEESDGESETEHTRKRRGVGGAGKRDGNGKPRGRDKVKRADQNRTAQGRYRVKKQVFGDLAEEMVVVAMAFAQDPLFSREDFVASVNALAVRREQQWVEQHAKVRLAVDGEVAARVAARAARAAVLAGRGASAPKAKRRAPAASDGSSKRAKKEWND